MVSIIIPVKDDKEIFNLVDQLKRKQPRFCQVYIILNNVTSSFYRKIKLKTEKIKNCHILSLAKADIASARNLGIVESDGQYCLFIDSDCRFSHHYFSVLFEYLKKRPEPLCVRGKVVFIPRNSFFSKLNCLMRTKSYLRHDNVCYCPNLLVSRSIFDRVGLFSNNIGDAYWGAKALKHGFKIKHFPKLEIVHIDDVNILKTIKQWFYYGTTRFFRRKIEFQNKNFKKIDYLYGLFGGSNLIDKNDSIFYILFVLFHYLARDLGVVYGFFRWKLLNNQKLN